jgi:hypothetical protein
MYEIARHTIGMDKLNRLGNDRWHGWNQRIELAWALFAFDFTHNTLHDAAQNAQTKATTTMRRMRRRFEWARKQ